MYAKVKDYSKERNKVLTYFEVGKLLSEAGKKYGNDVIGCYAEKLAIEVGKKYNVRTLRRIRQFYNVFKDKKWSPSATVLTWSHYTELLALNDINKINYYIDICKKQSLSRNDLRNKIKSNEYERLSEETKNKLITNEELKLPDLVPDPLLIKSEFNIEQLTEYALKQAILNNLDNFLTQLGNGFSYIGNEYKMKVGNNYNYIDLLLYNFKYKCFVVIELKVTELKKEHIGQIEVYMNYIDKNVKDVSDDKTIGIIICAKNNQFIIEYCSDERIFAREFKITS
ncbi:MAG: PDDEXK nuclease domain-containing protein [Bacilli bacterium]|nr:PDDEXK nuclease domain-containing protein [Bacilli bacterium]